MNMKSLILATLLSILFVSCQKENEVNPMFETYQEVELNSGYIRILDLEIKSKKYGYVYNVDIYASQSSTTSKPGYLTTPNEIIETTKNSLGNNEHLYLK